MWGISMKLVIRNLLNRKIRKLKCVDEIQDKRRQPKFTANLETFRTRGFEMMASPHVFYRTVYACHGNQLNVYFRVCNTTHASRACVKQKTLCKLVDLQTEHTCNTTHTYVCACTHTRAHARACAYERVTRTRMRARVFRPLCARV